MHQITNVFNENTFYPKFVEDLNFAHSLVIIQSPFLRIKRIEKLFTVFENCRIRGVRICVYAQRPYQQTKEDELALLECNNFLSALGIHVTYVPLIHEKLATIDEDILWEGSLNILSQNYSKERMTRWTSKDQVFRAVQMHKLDSCKSCLVPKEDFSALGKILSSRRKELGLSQKDLALRTGLSPTVVSYFEAGKRDIKISTLFSICSELRMNLRCLPWHMTPALDEKQENFNKLRKYTL